MRGRGRAGCFWGGVWGVSGCGADWSERSCAGKGCNAEETAVPEQCCSPVPGQRSVEAGEGPWGPAAGGGRGGAGLTWAR